MSRSMAVFVCFILAVVVSVMTYAFLSTLEGPDARHVLCWCGTRITSCDPGLIDVVDHRAYTNHDRTRIENGELGTAPVCRLFLLAQ